MKPRKIFSPKDYVQKNPQTAKVIKKAINRGVKEYAETFRRLANV